MLTYEEQAKGCGHPLAKKLLNLMAEKKTNLAFSADLTQSEELLDYAHRLGPEICVFKTHIDTLSNFSKHTTDELKRLAKTHRFIIFEDRKFADIGNTVKLQYEGGLFKIAHWAPITNAHILPGSGIIEGLKTVGKPLGNGLLLLAQMSSEGQLCTEAYTQNAVKMAKMHSDFVMGFICQERLIDSKEAPGFIHMTPGVKLESGQDSLGQRYMTPEIAIAEANNDVIIVGRGIYNARNPLEAAKTYRQAGWDAYQMRQRQHGFK